MKAGDLVRWKADGGLGVVLTSRISGRLGGCYLVYIHWFDGGHTGPISDTHEQLELISENR